MDKEELKDFLEENYYYFNRKNFIQKDPIQVPHSFDKREDIEIAAFLTATIAWGSRPVIIRNAKNLLCNMPDGPYEFLMNADANQLESYNYFKHRTFNGVDCVFFLKSLKNIYKHHGGLKKLFEETYLLSGSIPDSIRHFRNIFFSIPFPGRTVKHIANIDKGAAAKRINMFLRWMVRKDEMGVDFGLWDKIPSSALYIPLDVHTAKVSRELGLLKRTQNDWKAVGELTNELRKIDPLDPVKYDFALFGISAIQKF